MYLAIIYCQWGSASSGTATSTITVTFPTAYPSACLSVQVNYPAAKGTQYDCIYLVAWDLTKSNFKVQQYAANTPHDWISVGY